MAIGGAAEAGVVWRAGLRAFEIDHAVLGLIAVEVVVAVEDDVDFVLHEEVVDGQVPAGALGGKAGAAIGVVAAPFVFVADFDAAAGGELRDACGGLRAAADDVVHEDEFVSGAAVFERVAEPVVLRFAECPMPGVVGAVGIGGDVPEGIERDEEGLAPFKGVVVLQQAERAAGVVFGCGIASVEGIGHGVG